MGLSPFATTVGSTSNPASDSAVPRGARGVGSMWHATTCWRPNRLDRPQRHFDSPIRLPRFSHTQTFVSCSSRLRRSGAAGGFGSTGERGPPPPARSG